MGSVRCVQPRIGKSPGAASAVPPRTHAAAEAGRGPGRCGVLHGHDHGRTHQPPRRPEDEASGGRATRRRQDVSVSCAMMVVVVGMVREGGGGADV